MINVAIIEDDNIQHEIVKKYLNSFSENRNISINIKEYFNGIDFIDDYSNDIDIIFMDIEMPYLNGFETSNKIREIDENVIIIVISHSASYAVKGYEINALGYLVKPILKSNFDYVLEKAVSKLLEKRNNFIFLKTKDNISKIFLDDLYFVEVSSHMLSFNTKHGKIIIRGNLQEYEELLLKHHFAKCDNSCIVNLKYCENIDIKERIVLVGGVKINISRPKKKSFIEQFTLYAGDNF